jgi:hypothetical protein
MNFLRGETANLRYDRTLKGVKDDLLTKAGALVEGAFKSFLKNGGLRYV